jgi:two-component system, OmpR family, heavy metal sensor histidine kinase CusS
MSETDTSRAPEIAASAAKSERQRLASLGAGVRLLAGFVFLGLGVLGWGLSRQSAWREQFAALTAYTMVAAILFAIRHRDLLARIALFPVALDLAAAYLALRATIASYAEAGEIVAGLGLGIFVLIVAFDGLSLQRRFIIVTTIIAMAEETFLLHQAGVWPRHMLLACAVLGLAAGIGVIIFERTNRLVHEAAGIEAARHQLANTRAEYDQLARLQRDKDSLVQLIVHDMRGPLSAAILSLEFLSRELKRQRATRDMLEASEDALTSSSNVANMISQILDTTKLEEGRITLNLVPVSAREMLELARQQALSRAQGKSVSVEVDAPDTLFMAADRRLFPRLLDNLVSNALRYTSTGGHILLVAAASGSDVVLSVHNTGEAIPVGDRERIFAKFQQGETETQRMFGWGLGLYFCRLVAEAHSGRIAVEDVVGWPTSFVIRLPLLALTPSPD